jgi:hypothetical protein
MCVNGGEDGGEVWRWRRRWRICVLMVGRTWEEEMLAECRLLLDGVFLQDNILDRWQWDPDIHDVYTVRGAYHILSTPVAAPLDMHSDQIWHKHVP